MDAVTTEKRNEMINLILWTIIFATLAWAFSFTLRVHPSTLQMTIVLICFSIITTILISVPVLKELNSFKLKK